MPHSALMQAVKKPQQPRSKASLERMVTAAHELMIDRGGEDFTLQDVSRRGEVSIGSIYHRFGSKDDLVRTVIDAAMGEMADAERAAFTRTLDQSRSLAEFVHGYIAGYAAILRDHALMLSLAQRQASTDPEFRREGALREKDTADEMARGIRVFASEIAGDDRMKARLAFPIAFAALTRHLSLAMQDPEAEQKGWDELVDGLSEMIMAFLTTEAN